MSRRLSLSIGILVFAVQLAGWPVTAEASSFTPEQWQQRIEKHAIAKMIGQRKHTTWVRDRNRNFIDDEIEARFHPGEVVNIVVDLNDCFPPQRIEELLAKYGKVTYVGKLITFVLVNNVRFDDLPKLAAQPEVAMIEWQVPGQIMNDVSNRAVQARSSVTFSPNTAEDAGFTGTGINVAILDTGVDDTHEAFAGKFVAGFNTFNPADPGDGSTHPGDDHGHGTHVAGIALARETPGRNCRTPDDGSPANCGGMAPGAGVLAVKICDAFGSCPSANVARGLDWIGIHAATFHVRVLNMSIGFCAADDGTSAMPQQVNYVVALGVTAAIAHGNASNCGLAPGTVRTMAPGSASFAITAAGSDDRGTVNRGDDTIFSQFLRGPRSDFNLITPDLLALKPDIAAPGQNIWSALAGSTNMYFSDSGTSMASPHVAGAAADIIQARPDIDPGSLKDLLLRNADSSHNAAAFPAVDPAWDTSFGHGILNVWNAIHAAAATDVGFPHCVGPPATPGGLCQVTPPQPPWDNVFDISTANPPQVGVANTITAQVRNFGAVPATVLVNFGVYVFAVGNNQFFHVGTVQVTIPPGATVPVNQAWTPSASNHQCAQVSIAYGLDTNFGNNVTQRNLNVAPSVFEVRVENPYMVPARFEVRPKSDREAWVCKVSEETFTLDPFKECPRKLRVTFDAPPGTRPGERANCHIAVFATPQGSEKAQLIGGVTAQTFVPKPCQMIGTVVDEHGSPVAGARLTFTQQPTKGGRPITATTDQEGIFSAVLIPAVLQEAVVEKAGLGKGEISLRPSCGPCSMRFVLSKEGVRLDGTCRPATMAMNAAE